MKNSLVAITLFSIVARIQAQSVASQPNSITTPKTPFSVVQRDANSRVWARTNYEQNASGQTITNVNRYTELATGLHYKDPQTGQWLESKEQIDVLPTGGAQAVHGQHQVYFPVDIYDGVLEVVTSDGRHLQSRPVGVSYDDGTNSAWIAMLKHSSGLLVSSNKVVYPDAFNGFKADLVCTYRRSGFECDLIMRENPPQPGVYGLDSNTSTLQLTTEFFNTADPDQIRRQTILISALRMTP